MTRLRPALALVAAALLTAPAAAAAGNPPAQPEGCELETTKDRPVPGAAKLRRVPQQHATIGEAVQAAEPGDTILIGPGVYRESVTVPEEKPHLRIRGTDRAEVVLDGRTGSEDPDEKYLGSGLEVRADGTVVENLTIRHFLHFPVLVSGVRGFWLRHLTLYRSPSHNLVIGSRCGQIDNVVGHWFGAAALAVHDCGNDAVGPCDMTFTQNVLSNSAYGMVLEDAEKGLRVTGNTVRDNHFGVVLSPLSPFGDPEPTGRARIVVSDNLVKNNDEIDDAPQTILTSDDFRGNGIIVNTIETVVRGNRVLEHDERPGIAVSASPFGVPESGGWNEIRDNVIGCLDSEGRGTSCFARATRQHRLYGAEMAHETSGPGTCWSGNVLPGDGGDPVTLPEGLQDDRPCDGDPAPGAGTERGLGASFLFATAVRDRSCALEREPERRCPVSPAWDAMVSDKPDARSVPSGPDARVSVPDDNGNGKYVDDGGVDVWLPQVRPWQDAG